MAFIPKIATWTGLSPEHTFYGLRFLLGLAEAGFFPGIIFFLTLWFPASYRGRIVSYFMAAIPLSSAIGSPVSAALLGLHGAAGLAGWQWLFIIEALPSILLAFVVFFYLTDRPADATWLSASERDWLQRRLAAEDARRTHVSPGSIFASLYDYRVLALALVYFGNVACLYGVTFWLPSIVKGFGVSIAATGWISAIPYIVGFLGMMWWGLRSDQQGERTYHLAGALLLAAVGIGGSAFLVDLCRQNVCADDRRPWGLLRAAAAVDPAHRVSCGRGGCAGHRRDQRHRQPLRLFWPLRHGLDQGSDRRVSLGARHDRHVRSCRPRHHPLART
jgi:MFS family permease